MALVKREAYIDIKTWRFYASAISSTIGKQACKAV